MCGMICSSCLCTMRLLRSWCVPWMIPLSALLALTCHFALDFFTVMHHGLSGVLVDVEAVLSAAAPDLDDDRVTTQAAAASVAEVEVVTLF